MKEEGVSRFKPDLSTIIITIIMLIITLSFFYLLGTQVSLSPGLGDDGKFGAGEIVFALISASVAVALLIWIKNFMANRPYLGAIIGILALAAYEYVLFQRYTGPYTTTYAIIITIVVLAYLGYFFIKYRKTAPRNEEE
jgi:hypothetical protein